MIATKTAVATEMQVPEMKKIRKSEADIVVESDQLVALVAELEQSLSALEELPEFPFDVFLGLLRALVYEVSVSVGSAALVASDDRISLRVPLYLELFAAALSALKDYLCHEASPLSD